MATPINWNRWDAMKRAVESALSDGFAPPRVGGGKGACVPEATRRLAAEGIELDDSTVNSWILMQERRAKRGIEHRLPDWTLYRQATPSVRVSERSRVRRRWLLTAAQNETRVHDGFWANLRTFAAYLNAEIVVGPFTYQLGVFTDHTTRNNVFAEAVRPFLRFDRMECGAVLFCAEMNTLPTANRPLSGLHSYSRGRSAVFPHAKIALESIPSMPGVPVPIIMTTGACTVENYVPKKAGLKAAFHHVIGATVVEEDEDGRTFCRQVNAADDGSFQDLDLAVREGRVLGGQRIEAATWGDIHRRKLNRDVALSTWGFDTETGATVASDSILDVLRPRYQFFHDLIDFESRNHHEDNDPHARFSLFVRGRDNLEDEFREGMSFIRATEREWSKSVIVSSNHEGWLNTWLKRADYRRDEVNAIFFLKNQLAAYEARARGDFDFNPVRHALAMCDRAGLVGIDFCPENGSYTICQSFGGIECGAHGHLGPNGARGSSASLVRISVKMNKGHDHTASILDGVYSAGVSGDLDMGYNVGPGSWSHSHILTYPNSKRTIITLQDGRWRA